MNLRERLRMMRPAGPRSAEPPEPWSSEPPIPPSAEPVDTRAELGGFAPCGVRTLPPVEGVEQRLINTPLGRVLCLERVYPLDHFQGRVPLEVCLRVPRRGWERLLSRALPETFDAATAVFLDLETTGLGRGTGTYAFLVGVGRFTDNGFRVRQYFMRDYPEEPAVMAAVQAELESARGLITFNGRTFDWPLLETRATLNRMRLPFLPHLDLLHPARRVWRPISESCRLSDLEASVLGHYREDDVPGALIPQLYFHYLRTGDTRPLAGVFEHNRLDIVSMACMAGYLGQAIASPLAARPGGAPLAPPELYTLGRLLLDQGAIEEAIACLEEAVARGLPHALRREGYRLLAIAHRRQRRTARTGVSSGAACAVSADLVAGVADNAAGCTREAGGELCQAAGEGADTARAAAPSKCAPDVPDRAAGAGDPAVAVLLRWVREDGLSTWPYVELAKHFEHRAKDPAAARHWTLRAIEIVQRRRALRGLAGSRSAGPAPADRELEDLLHRLRRLERKLAASGGRRGAISDERRNEHNGGTAAGPYAAAGATRGRDAAASNGAR